jgi:hypothetical protein
MAKAAAASAGEPSKDYLGMSDDDFLNINGPSAPPEEETAAAIPEAEKIEAEPVTKQEETPPASTVSAEAEKPAKAEEVVESAPVVAPKVAKLKAKAEEILPSGSEPKAAEAEATPEAETPAEPVAVDYENFFKKIMTPFKANGRTIEVKTTDEAIRLMQMGAGYGRKIQDLQPHLKVLRMLEKNDLLDEGKLSLLIDVNQKNPDAIKKIIKDSGIDPLDLNTEDNVSYFPTNHAVSDKEIAFTQALADVQTYPDGQETLRIINQTWDLESKSLLWESPQLLGVIQSQRDNGIYAQIAAEIDRQKLLGTIPHSAPFIQAYKQVGDHLLANGGLKPSATAQTPQIQTQPGVTPQPQVIATRAAAPKAQVQNGDKAAAASATKTTSTHKSGLTVNPLNMADDEFLKQFANRL